MPKVPYGNYSVFSLYTEYDDIKLCVITACNLLNKNHISFSLNSFMNVPNQTSHDQKAVNTSTTCHENLTSRHKDFSR